MKHYSRLFTLAFCLFGASLFAQTQQGSVMIGGQAGFVSSEGSTAITIAPMAGFFVIDQLAVGGAIQLEVLNPDGGESRTTFGIGPMLRYYFNGEGKARFFGQGSFSWANVSQGGESASATGFGVALGLDVFLNDHVAIEPAINYVTASSEGVSVSSFAVTIGVQAFIGGN